MDKDCGVIRVTPPPLQIHRRLRFVLVFNQNQFFTNEGKVLAVYTSGSVIGLDAGVSYKSGKRKEEQKRSEQEKSEQEQVNTKKCPINSMDNCVHRRYDIVHIRYDLPAEVFEDEDAAREGVDVITRSVMAMACLTMLLMSTLSPRLC